MKSIPSVAFATIAVTIALLSQLTPISAKESCASKSCALACNRQTHACGLYDRKHVPSGYLRVSYMPAGYHRSDTECTSIRCPNGSTTCQRWGIAKKSQ